MHSDDEDFDGDGSGDGGGGGGDDDGVDDEDDDDDYEGEDKRAMMISNKLAQRQRPNATCISNTGKILLVTKSEAGFGLCVVCTRYILRSIARGLFIITSALHHVELGIPIRRMAYADY